MIQILIVDDEKIERNGWAGAGRKCHEEISSDKNGDL